MRLACNLPAKVEFHQVVGEGGQGGVVTMVEKTNNQEKQQQQNLGKMAAEFAGAWAQEPMAKKAETADV